MVEFTTYYISVEAYLRKAGASPQALRLVFRKYRWSSKHVGLLPRKWCNNFSRRDLHDRIHRSTSVVIVVIEGNTFMEPKNTK